MNITPFLKVNFYAFKAVFLENCVHMKLISIQEWSVCNQELSMIARVRYSTIFNIKVLIKNTVIQKWSHATARAGLNGVALRVL
jgi:hypothetical protein